MAYTFGAGTGDDINWASQATIMATARSVLVCGWWYPTTLTAGRGIWSAHTTNINGAEIAAATNEIVLRTDNVTTDGQWTTTGAGLTLNTWTFLAFMSSTLNGTPSAAWRVWSGTIDTPPIECTVTQNTAPAGNFTGGAIFYIGNKGTGTVAFQGIIDEVGFCTTAAAAGASTHPFSLAAIGAITDAEALFTYERFIVPYWLGLGWAPAGLVRRNGSSVNTEDASYWSGDMLARVIRYNTATGESSVAPTINGATYSPEDGPRAMLIPSPIFSPRRH